MVGCIKMFSCRYTISFLLQLTWFLMPICGQEDHTKFTRYSIEDGLSNNYVYSIFQDSQGWMWFGTFYGLNRFDGYDFNHYLPSESDSSSIKGRFIRAIMEDGEGNLWIGTESGLNLYDRTLDRFSHLFILNGDENYNLSPIHSLLEGPDGLIWIGTEDGLFYLDKKINQIFNTKNYSEKISANLCVNSMVAGADRILWLGTNKGIYSLNLDNYSVEYYPINIEGSGEPLINEIHEIFKDTRGRIWAGSYMGGLNLLNAETRLFENVLLPEENSRQKTIRDIVEFMPGKYYLATRDGLILYDMNEKDTSIIKNDPYNNLSLLHNSVLELYKDFKGDLWIGTRGGICYLNTETQEFISFTALPGNNHYLNASEIWAITEVSENRIWIGTEDGGINILDREKGTFTILNSENSGLKSNNIKSIYEDSRGTIWIGTFLGGLYKIIPGRPDMEIFVHDINRTESISDDRIWYVFEDSRNKIWIGTYSSLDVYDPLTNSFIHFGEKHRIGGVQFITENKKGDLIFASEEKPLIIYNEEKNSVSELNISARVVYEDRKGNYWLGTIGNGLINLSSDFNVLRKYRIEEGLCDNTIYGIMEDKQGNLWLSTMNGLSRFNPQSEEFWNFKKQDGIQSNRFNYNAFCSTTSGEFIIGGINGINIFDPGKIRKNSYVPPVVFTSFQIANNQVEIGNYIEGDILLNKSINEIEEIHLNHKHNTISFQFAALNFTSSMDNQYAYFLEGFDHDWNYIGDQRKLTFTNLEPGSYNLYVKASNNDGIWNEQGISLKINMKPPPTRTWWFKLLLILTLLLIMTTIVYFISTRQRLKNQVVFERIKSKKIHELDLMKFKIFTNISHELRTPLTLILSPLERLIKNDLNKEETQRYLNMMHRNSKRMFSLINQLLDFRKLEAGKLRLDYIFGDLVSFLKEETLSFKDFAAERKIELTFESVMEQIYIWYDPDKIEMVLNNLISNAIKFTPESGYIQVKVSLVLKHHQRKRLKGTRIEEQSKYVQILVEDTGEGIPKDQLNRIFDRFYSQNNPGSVRIRGTGIGLSLSKDLVNMHGGEMSVQSEPGEGSCFEILLPFSKLAPEGVTQKSQQTESDETVLQSDNSDPGKPILMIIEDNQDLLSYIRSLLEADYKIIESTSFKKGWEMILKHIPDIILTDLLLPDGDGLNLCKTIKEDQRTSHIPIMILTALASKEHEKEGFLAGADAYISKPFDQDILHIRIKHILNERRKMKDRYITLLSTGIPDEKAASPDDKFIRKAMEIANNHIENPEFDIEAFSREMGISRTQLYRKFNSIMNITINEFIKQVRLKKAAELIRIGELNISEIAYRVGFNDVTYFRKCFKKQYNSTPSEFRSREI